VDYPDRQPGEVFEIPVAGIPAKKTADFSLHQFPTVNLLQELHNHTEVEIHIVVAQVRELPEEVRPGLSPEVAGAIKDACARILHILGFAYS
jgi:coenzyme F420 hydrogenase subunit delta